MEEKDIHIEDEEQQEVPIETVDSGNKQDGEDKSEEAQRTEEKDPLDVALEEIATLKDTYLRQVAEFDSYRKRTMKERAELILNGSEKTVTALLPVIDDMERALKSGEKEEDPQVLREGMDMI